MSNYPHGRIKVSFEYLRRISRVFHPADAGSFQHLFLSFSAQVRHCNRGVLLWTKCRLLKK